MLKILLAGSLLTVGLMAKEDVIPKKVYVGVGVTNIHGATYGEYDAVRDINFGENTIGGTLVAGYNFYSPQGSKYNLGGEVRYSAYEFDESEPFDSLKKEYDTYSFKALLKGVYRTSMDELDTYALLGYTTLRNDYMELNGIAYGAGIQFPVTGTDLSMYTDFVFSEYGTDYDTLSEWTFGMNYKF